MGVQLGADFHQIARAYFYAFFTLVNQSGSILETKVTKTYEGLEADISFNSYVNNNKNLFFFSKMIFHMQKTNDASIIGVP